MSESSYISQSVILFVYTRIYSKKFTNMLYELFFFAIYYMRLKNNDGKKL